MRTEKIAERAYARIRTTVGDRLTEDQLAELGRIVSDLTIEVARETAQLCNKRATELYGPQTDLASAIADELKRSKVALIANLQSMR